MHSYDKHEVTSGPGVPDGEGAPVAGEVGRGERTQGRFADELLEQLERMPLLRFYWIKTIFNVKVKASVCVSSKPHQPLHHRL